MKTEADLLARIVVNPKVMLGKPVLKGTRITVELVLRLLARGCLLRKSSKIILILQKTILLQFCFMPSKGQVKLSNNN
jgi:hypothetical protein